MLRLERIREKDVIGRTLSKAHGVREMAEELSRYGKAFGMSEDDLQEIFTPEFRQKLQACEELRENVENVNNGKQVGFDWEEAGETTGGLEKYFDEFVENNEERFHKVITKGLEQYEDFRSYLRKHRPDVEARRKDLLDEDIKKVREKAQEIVGEHFHEVEAFRIIRELKECIQDVKQLSTDSLFSAYPDIHLDIEDIKKYGKDFGMSENAIRDMFDFEVLEDYNKLRENIKDINNDKEVEGFDWKKAIKTAGELERYFDDFFEDNDSIIRGWLTQGLKKYDTIRDDLLKKCQPKTKEELRIIDSDIDNIDRFLREEWIKSGRHLLVHLGLDQPGPQPAPVPRWSPNASSMANSARWRFSLIWPPA